MIELADPKMRKIMETVDAVATSRATVLITGESGTGKEILARRIHQKSSRAHKRLVAINCAAVPEGLLESELFGYERGAFTGADQRKIGKFEQANDSTFLLDEVSEMSLPLQAKLLRVLQENEVERLGGSQPIKINVRVIATTNRSMEKMVKQGEFREDLFYRLNVIPIAVPPLRSRPLDIVTLAQHFVAASCRDNNLEPRSLDESAIEILKSYRWPGNVREMQNVIERTVLLCPKALISANDIQLPEGLQEEHPTLAGLAPGMTVSEAERLLIMKTLDFTSQNRTRAAEMLGISIRTLRNKLNEYKVQIHETDL